MDAARSINEEKQNFFTYIIEQQWLMFVLLGVIMVGIRLFNMRQRAQHQQLLRETIMVELGYTKNARRKKTE
ncbi:unnamed protein product [Phytomonas sp. EM1]|nr:unnamed protein product [Phytomonas sp. EM1]|eukprot:CCW61026.1 unnamed protein product [Phytomonas sp. isolate EM1]